MAARQHAHAVRDDIGARDGRARQKNGAGVFRAAEQCLHERFGLDDARLGREERAARAYVRFAHANQGWFRMWFARVNNERMHQPEHRAFVERLLPLGMRSRTNLRAVVLAIVGKESPVVDDLYRTVWGLTHGLSVFVVERVFQLVQTDEERIAAADAAITVQIDALRARYR